MPGKVFLSFENARQGNFTRVLKYGGIRAIHFPRLKWLAKFLLNEIRSSGTQTLTNRHRGMVLICGGGRVLRCLGIHGALLRIVKSCFWPTKQKDKQYDSETIRILPDQ